MSRVEKVNLNPKAVKTFHQGVMEEFRESGDFWRILGIAGVAVGRLMVKLLG